MESCGGSQYWARDLQKLGHHVKLLKGKFVKAFVMGNKNDVMDARAIWMAVQQPVKSIAVKSEEQQAILGLHRMRQQLVKFRIAQINALHGLLLECGETTHKGRTALAKDVPEALERLKKQLPNYLIIIIKEQYYRIFELDDEINSIDQQLMVVAKQNETCRRLLKIQLLQPQ